MGRRIDPKWHEDGVIVIREFDPDALQLQRIRESIPLALSEKDWKKIQDSFIFIGEKYQNWSRSGANVATRAEARKCLKQLLGVEEIRQGHLNALNARASDELFNELVHANSGKSRRSPPPVEIIYNEQLDKEPLRPVIRACIERLKKEKGANKDRNLAWAVSELCKGFELITSTKVTLSNKGEHRTYHSDPSGQGSAFIIACFAAIDPTIRGHTLSSGIRLYIEKRA
ncbi:MAG: hypothetical protein WEA84_00790 [Rhodovibrionaceae bacterium]